MTMQSNKQGWFISHYTRLFNWIARPEQKTHPVQAFRVHSLLFVFSVAQFLMLLFAGVGLAHISHPSILWFPWLTYLALWVGMAVYYQTGRLRMAAHILMLSIATTILYYCCLTDGFRQTASSWLLVMPILAAMLVNGRWMIRWAFGIILVNGLAHLGDFPTLLDPTFQRQWIAFQQSTLLMAMGLVTFFLVKQQQISSLYLRERIIAKENLMRILVHDISNPLSIIRLSAQLLAQAGDDITPAKIGLRIEKSAERITNIIHLISDMEAWESGKRKIALQPLHLGSVLEEVRLQQQNRLISKRIQLNFSYLGDEHVWGHPTMLSEQIFGNLITNAIKFSPEGGHIDIKVEPSSRHEVLVTVQDHGIGIPPKLLEMLFDPLASTNRAGTAGEAGTGYGLPITRNCLAVLGGRIEVSSRTAEQGGATGTTVRVILRRADSPQSRRDNS